MEGFFLPCDSYGLRQTNLLYTTHTYTIGSGYTNKNKFMIAIETLRRFIATIVTLPVLILLLFNKLLVSNIF